MKAKTTAADAHDARGAFVCRIVATAAVHDAVLTHDQATTAMLVMFVGASAVTKETQLMPMMLVSGVLPQGKWAKTTAADAPEARWSLRVLNKSESGPKQCRLMLMNLLMSNRSGQGYTC